VNELIHSISVAQGETPLSGVAAAYVRKSGKQAGKFSRKIRNLYKNQEL
jgi:hypothetical protein